jgi:serine/threonine-protein kinase HipA
MAVRKPHDGVVEVTVQIGGEDIVAGRLFMHARRGTESASFTYDQSYLGHPNAYTLDPALPRGLGPQHTPAEKAIFTAFSDAAPDRWGRSLMERGERSRAKALGVTPRTLTSADFLLGVNDFLRQGAIRFREPGSDVFFSRDGAGIPYLVSLSALLEAADAVERGSQTDARVQNLVAAGGSLGGARPKAAVMNGRGRLCIAKFPKSHDVDEWDVIGWEKVALDMAADAGITVPKTELIRIDGRHALLLERFDRSAHGRIGYV